MNINMKNHFLFFININILNDYINHPTSILFNLYEIIYILIKVKIVYKNLMENKKSKIKFILVGDKAVGKTSLITQYANKTFTENYIMTIGADKQLKNINIGGKEVSLEIFDTVGQEEFRAINKLFMKKTDVALIVYDITNRKSFEELSDWFKIVKEINGNKNVIFGIAANKSDLYEQKVVNKKEGEEFAKKNNEALFFETSAKDYDSVENVFLTLCEQFLNNNEKEEKEEEKKEEKEEDKKPFETEVEPISPDPIPPRPCCCYRCLIY